MMVHTTQRRIGTKGQGDAHDLTELVTDAIEGSGISNGIATVTVVGSTAGVTTIEFEPGAVWDLNQLLERLTPRAGEYRHHLRWGDDNGSSHVRGALIGPSLTVPVIARKAALGTWQQVTLFEFDTRPRQRDVIVQVLGEP
jgi:secondary thiamine-phosphate synthase enzyme